MRGCRYRDDLTIGGNVKIDTDQWRTVWGS